MMKRLLSLMLAIVMVLSMLPTAAFAAGEIDSEAEKPNATVTVLEPVTLTALEHSYKCWPSGDNTIERPLEIVMNFKANEDAKKVATSPYARWLVDFYLTVTGLEGDSIIAENCYLAGNYGTFGWIVIPTDGLEIKEGVSYPVVAAYDATLNYKDICTSVKDFTAAIHIDSKVLKDNPNMQIELALKMTNPDDKDDVLVVGEPAVYSAEELKNGVQTTPNFEIVIPSVSDIVGDDASQNEVEVVNGVREDILTNTALKDFVVDTGSEVRTFEVALSEVKVEGGIPARIIFTVKPLDEDGNKITNTSKAITFRLPVPSSVAEIYKHVEVFHDGESMGFHEIKGTKGGYYVEVTSGSFSEFAIEPVAEQENNFVAMIGEDGFETLTEAITAAAAGQTIQLVDDINENVTISKKLTIDGAGKNYTGKMTVSDNKTVTITNVKFVKGCIDESKGSRGNLTVTNCTFDGENSIGYAITVRGGDKLVIENCMTENYSVGMLYIPSAVAAISVKNVEVNNVAAAFNISYSGNGTFEGIRLNNVEYGLHVQNHGARTFTLKEWETVDCEYPIYVQVKGTATVSFEFEGVNNLGAKGADLFNYGTLKMAPGATLTAAEGLTISTEEGYTVKYVDGTYFVAENVAKIGEQGYITLAEAIETAKSGDVITLLKDIKLVKGTDSEQYVGKDGAKKITIDLGGHTLSSVGMRTLIAYTAGTELTIQNGTVSSDISGTLTATYNGKLILGENLTVTSDGNYGVYINRGKLEVSEPAVYVAGRSRAIGIKAHDDNELAIRGGTYSHAISVDYIEDGYTGIWTADSKYQIVGGVKVVNGTEVTYHPTLQEAVEAAANGAVITLLADQELTWDGETKVDGIYAAMVAVSGKEVTIDLNGKTVSADSNIGQTLFAAFAADEGGKLTLNDSKGTGSVTVTGEAAAYCMLMAYEPGTAITVNGGSYYLEKASDSLIYSGGDEIVTVNGGTFVLGNCGEGSNGKPWIFNALGSNDRNVLVNGGAFNADVNHQYWAHEVVVPADKALKDNGDGTWMVVNASAIAVELSSGYKRTVGHTSLQEAIKAVADGETVTLLSSFYLYANKENATTRTIRSDLVDFDNGAYSAFFVIEGKSVTVDLNGYKIQGYTRGAENMVVGMFVTDNNGHLTLNDSKGSGLVRIAAQNAKVYSLITNYEPGCSITINGGTYTLDKASDCLIYSGVSANEGQGDQGIVVNGGNFELGNVGTGRNQSPWIFNALGQNHNHVWVTGGTFNSDVNHQYWVFEAQLPETSALKNNGNGTWTVVEAAAYVNEVHGKYVKPVGYATVEEALAAAGDKNVIVLKSVDCIEIPAEFQGTLTLGDCELKYIAAADTADIVIKGNVVINNPNGSAITGKVLNISGTETGRLTAIANGSHAYGIGGDQTEQINLENLHIVDVKGGYVQPEFINDLKYGKSEPEGGAAIGSGYDGAVINLTAVTIENAQGGSKAAGIGARYHTGVTINITNCDIRNVEGGNASAGIGGSRVSNGMSEGTTTITIVGSTVKAKGGQGGAGIGSGYDTHCQSNQPICTINIDGCIINAVGGKYAAGIGTGYHNAGLAGEIKNSAVTAISGEKFYKDAYTQAQDIGFGVVDPAREALNNTSSITNNSTVIGIPQIQ